MQWFGLNAVVWIKPNNKQITNKYIYCILHRIRKDYTGVVDIGRYIVQRIIMNNEYAIMNTVWQDNSASSLL